MGNAGSAIGQFFADMFGQTLVTEENKDRVSRHQWIGWTIFLVIICAIAVGVFLYIRYNKPNLTPFQKLESTIKVKQNEIGDGHVSKQQLDEYNSYTKKLLFEPEYEQLSPEEKEKIDTIIKTFSDTNQQYLDYIKAKNAPSLSRTDIVQ